jgi:hypothetical protein
MGIFRHSNYPFLTPRKKESKSRIQGSEIGKTRGVKNRQLVFPPQRRKGRRQKPGVSPPSCHLVNPAQKLYSLSCFLDGAKHGAFAD